MSNSYTEFLVEVPGLVTNALDKIRAVTAKAESRQVDTIDKLMSAESSLNEAVFELSSIFEEVGSSEDLTEAFELAHQEVSRAERALLAVTTDPQMRELTLKRLATLLGVHPRLRTPSDASMTMAAVWLENDEHLNGGAIYRIVLRQHLVAGNLASKGLVRIPAWLVHWCRMLRQGIFEPITNSSVTAIDNPETLVTALAVWEPYDDGPLASFEEAALAALQL